MFALPRSEQPQPMASQACLGPGIIHLGSERHFLALPWLFSLAREEVGTPHTQISSLGLESRCQNPAQGSPHLPMNRDQNSPPPSQAAGKQQTQCSEDKLAWEWAVGGEFSKFPLSPPDLRRKIYP